MATRTVGIIGAGRIGGTVARLAVAAGYSVVVSNSRGPQTLGGLVAELGPRARAATPSEAAEAGEVVVVSVPVRAYRALPVEALEGKVVIDTINYDPKLHGAIAELDRAAVTTSELVQERLPRSLVVKALNNIFFQSLQSLARPHGAPDRSALPIAGDDPGAKVVATHFIDALGYDAVDAGPLAEGWRWQPGTPAHLLYAGESFRVAVAADGERVREFLNAATPIERQTMTDSKQTPRIHGATDEERRLIETLYRGIGGEPDLLDDVLAPDWEDIPSIPGQPLGPEGMKPHILAFHESFADARVIIHDIVAASGVVAVRGEMAGTHRGEFLGVPPTGRSDSFTIHEFHEIVNGRIARSWHLEDLHGWMERAR